MAERPILFSGPMVRAITREVDPKTQTRRVVKPQPPAWARFPQPAGDGWEWTDRNVDADDLKHWPDYYKPMRCPYGVPGDRLWVRETFARTVGAARGAGEAPVEYVYRADQVYAAAVEGIRWKPSIFMPRAACRLVLEVTAVRVERLQEISLRDCMAEGCAEDSRALGSANRWRHGYRTLWDSINAKRAPWASNPWVWVVEFQRVVSSTKG